MLQYTILGTTGKRFAGIVHHTGGECEICHMTVIIMWDVWIKLWLRRNQMVGPWWIWKKSGRWFTP